MAYSRLCLKCYYQKITIQSPDTPHLLSGVGILRQTPFDNTQGRQDRSPVDGEKTLTSSRSGYKEASGLLRVRCVTIFIIHLWRPRHEGCYEKSPAAGVKLRPYRHIFVLRGVSDYRHDGSEDKIFTARTDKYIRLTALLLFFTVQESCRS